MTKDEIIEMARRAGFEDFDRWCKHYPQETQRWCQRMETFANLVAQHEREACAIVCDDINAKYKWPDDVAERVASQWCADAIRAREQL